MPRRRRGIFLCSDKRTGRILSRDFVYASIGEREKMSVRKPQTGRPRSPGLTKLEFLVVSVVPCWSGARTKLDWDKLKLIFLEGRINDKPLFGPPPTMDETTRIVKKEINRKILRDCWEAAKYRHIVDLVQRQTTREDRLLLLARWLCEEKVCKLQDIVEVRVLHQLAKQKFAFFSRRDFRHADRVKELVAIFWKAY